MWERAREDKLGIVSSFCKAWEPSTCSLSDRLFTGMEADRNHWWKHLYLYGGDNIQGLLYANQFGLMLPFFPRLEDARLAARMNLAVPLPYALVGRDQDTLCFLRTWHEPRLHWHYHSLSIDRPVPSVTDRFALTHDFDLLGHQAVQSGGLIIRPARMKDLDRLLPLECEYQQEEVLAPGMQLNVDALRVSLGKSLEHGRTVLVELGSEIAAKASINALGFSCAQIGGVYTRPHLRNHGLATALMKFMVQAILEEGMGLTLFVKRDNLPALRVYEKLGFRPMGAYSIVYY